MSKLAETRHILRVVGEWIGHSNEFSEAYRDASTETIYSPVTSLFSTIHTYLHSHPGLQYSPHRPVTARVRNVW